MPFSQNRDCGPRRSAVFPRRHDPLPGVQRPVVGPRAAAGQGDRERRKGGAKPRKKPFLRALAAGQRRDRQAALTEVVAAVRDGGVGEQELVQGGGAQALRPALDPVQAVEAPISLAAALHGFIPHGCRAHPYSIIAVEGAVDHHRLLGLGVPGDANNLVLFTLEMTITT